MVSLKRIALFLAVILAGSLYFPGAAQTARFPSAIATNADLFQAADRADTTLLTGIDGAALSLNVGSSARFTAPMIVTIDDEQLLVSAVPNGTTLTISTRGFGGTAAASHLASAKVQGRIVAYHHNSLKEEVKAIETALGPNLSAIDAKVSAAVGSIPSTSLLSTSYNFAPQTPGGSLAIGNNAITLTPVPAGVNGADVGHSLYISNGTGTAEAVLIVGGSAVAGDASGQLIIQCTYTHSGAWTVRSATAGIQEAVQSLPSYGGVIQVPAGVSTVQAGVYVGERTAVKIRGAGDLTTTVRRDTSLAAFNVFTFYSATGKGGNEVSGINIDTTGVSTTGYAISMEGQSSALVRDVHLSTPFGMHLTSVGYSWFYNISIPVVTHNGYGILFSGGIFDNDVHSIWMGSADAANPGFAALYFDNSGGASFYHDIDAIRFQKGVYLNASSGNLAFFFFENVLMDTMSDVGWHLSSTGGNLITVVAVNCWAAAAGNQGVKIDSTGGGSIWGVKWQDGRIVGNHGDGFKVLGANTFDTALQNSTVSGNGVVAGDEISIGSDVTRMTISGNTIGAGDAPANGLFWGEATAVHGINLSVGAEDKIFINGNRFTGGYTTAITNNSTGTNNRIENNAGYNPVGAATVTPGASPYTYTAGPTPEMLYIYGGTVSNISRGATQIASASPAQVLLPPNGTLTITYSVAPTIRKDVH